MFHERLGTKTKSSDSWAGAASLIPEGNFVVLTHIVCYCTFMEKNIIENKDFIYRSPIVYYRHYEVCHSEVRHPACFLMNHQFKVLPETPALEFWEVTRLLCLYNNFPLLSAYATLSRTFAIVISFLPLYLSYFPFLLWGWWWSSCASNINCLGFKPISLTYKLQSFGQVISLQSLVVWH